MARLDEIATVLAECPLFRGAPSEDIQALASIAASVSWPNGTVVFQQGDPSGFLAVVESGKLRLSIASAGGRELVLRHAARSAVIGEMGVLDEDVRSADATAVGASLGLLLHRKPFERVLAERPALALAVIRYLTRRLRETTYQLESVALYSLSGRLARFLLAALHQSRGAGLKPSEKLVLDLGQAEIAAILGASRPKLNRAFADLAEMGAIVRNDREMVCNTGRLTEIAESGEP